MTEQIQVNRGLGRLDAVVVGQVKLGSISYLPPIQGALIFAHNAAASLNSARRSWRYSWAQ